MIEGPLEESRSAQGGSPIDIAQTPAHAEIRRSLLSRLSVDRFSAFYLLAIFMVVFGIIVPDTFLSVVTFRQVSSDGVVTAVLALAFLIPATAGAFDISIGAMMSLALVLVSWLSVHTDLPAAVCVILALLACASVGFISGFIVVRLKVNSFIATLGMSQAITAAVVYTSDSQQIAGDFSNTYKNLGRKLVFGVPIVVLYLLVIALIVWYALEHLPIGRFLFATGGNPEASRLAGVRTDRAVWGAFVASGFVAGLAGIIFSMNIGYFSPSVGPGYVFPAAAAVFFGASQLSRRPNVWGTVVALYCLAIGVKGLQLRLPPGAYWVEPLFQGVALVGSVAFAAHQSRKYGRASAAASLT